MVYIDNAAMPLGRMKMAHMLADTLDELHAMADRLGLRRSWFQPRSTPHYDVSLEKRRLAIALGAKPVDRRELVAVIKRLRAARCST